MQRGRPSDQAPVSPLVGRRYLLGAVAVAASLLALYYYPYAENGIVAARVQSYLASYARAAGSVVSLFDPSVAVGGTTIRSPLFSMQIVKGCDAMEINILLIAALVAFPMPLWRRLVAAVLAVGLLFVFNVCRLCVLYWIGAHVPAWFDRAHQTLAPPLMVLSALVIFVLALHLHRASSGSGLARNFLPATRRVASLRVAHAAPSDTKP